MAKRVTAEGPVEGRWALPAGWRWRRARDLGKIMGGSTPKNASDPTNFTEDGIPWLTPADLSGYTGRTIGVGRRNLAPHVVNRAALLPTGSVLISSRAPVGYCAVTSNPMVTNQGFRSLVPADDVDPFFIRYYVLFSRKYLEDHASGTTFKELSGSALGDLVFPVPPIDVQRRIVARIDELFAEVDDGEAALARARADLATWRKALLKAAVTGELTADWRAANPAIETGTDLLTRIGTERRAGVSSKTAKKSTRDQKFEIVEPTSFSTLPEFWDRGTWDQIGISQNGKAFPSADYCNSGFKLLRPGNLFPDGYVKWSKKNTRCLPEDFAKRNASLIVRGGELVMNLTAQSLADDFLGRVCITSMEEECILNQRLARLTPVLMNTHFVWLVLRSPVFRSFVERLNTGSMIQHMYTSQLARFVFPIPPMEEQAEIVARATAMLGEGDALSGLITGFDEPTTLRQSILAAAFRGDLA